MVTPKVAGVLLVDDHTLYREGLRELIKHWDEFEVVGEAANGQEAVELCRHRHPEIVLMDVQMPVMDGIEATRLIRQECPATAVVMLTVSTEEKHLFEAIREGARGYVLKIIPARQLRDRLRGVLQGEVMLSGAVAIKVLEEFSRQRGAEAPGQLGPRQDEALTEREIQILRLVAEGLSNEEIGARLFLSEQTVKKRLSGVLQKLHLNNRVQAAAHAVRHGLAD